MDTSPPTMQQLFCQLGLPDDELAIQDFIRSHRPLPAGLRIFDAPFWSASQAALVKEKLQDDGNWAILVDTLNALLRVDPAALPDHASVQS